jgi:hypothetical protein
VTEHHAVRVIAPFNDEGAEAELAPVPAPSCAHIRALNGAISRPD